MLKKLMLAGALATCAAATAHAQDDTGMFVRDRDVSVMDRPHPEYDALGVREGGFLIFPKLETSIDYDDNIYAAPSHGSSISGTTIGSQSGPTGDGIFEAKGSLEARSDWSRNSLDATASVVHDAFFSHSTESNTAYDVGATGRLDILRDTNITVQGGFGHAVEARSDEDAETNSVNPIGYDHGLLDVKGVWTLNRFKLVGDFNWTGYEYTNGATSTGAVVDETYRDHSLFQGRVEGDYALSPATAVYLTATGFDFDYNNNADKALINRDSTGFEAAVGTDFELGALIRARFEIGYRRETFANAATPDVSGIDYHGKIQYFPSQLTTITATADRVLNDSGILLAPAYLSNDFSVEIDHEFLRNLIVSAIGNYTNASIVGLDRTDSRPGATVRASYLLNRGLGLNVSYNYLGQTSSGLDRTDNFAVNQVRIGLVLQY